MNADERVMAFLPSVLNRRQSDELADHFERAIRDRGWGCWAAELKTTQEFIGFIGLHASSARLPFAPCVEVSWRLAFPFWGQGLASEAAEGALQIGFHVLGLEEVVSFTATGNHRSTAVMQRLGMRKAGTFEHPHVPYGSALRKHCLFRLPRAGYDA
jgi:RimJ/RimL family protein N-acetyltransferase